MRLVLFSSSVWWGGVGGGGGAGGEGVAWVGWLVLREFLQALRSALRVLDPPDLIVPPSPGLLLVGDDLHIERKSITLPLSGSSLTLSEISTSPLLIITRLLDNLKDSYIHMECKIYCF